MEQRERVNETEEGSGPAAAAQARSHAGLALGRGQATAATTRARMAFLRVSQGRAREEGKGALCFRLRNPGLAVDRWHIADDRDTEQQQIHSALRKPPPNSRLRQPQRAADLIARAPAGDPGESVDGRTFDDCATLAQSYREPYYY